MQPEVKLHLTILDGTNSEYTIIARGDQIEKIYDLFGVKYQENDEDNEDDEN